LVQLTSHGGIYQTALVLRQDKDTTPLLTTVDVSWSPAVHRLATTCSIQEPEIGKLGARAMQEVDFRRAYQRISSFASGPRSHRSKILHFFSGLFFPLDATEAVYAAENAGAVYQTLDTMPLFWQEASPAHEHLLTTYARNSMFSSCIYTSPLDSILPFVQEKSPRMLHGLTF
jgi:hypothetical protein